MKELVTMMQPKNVRYFKLESTILIFFQNEPRMDGIIFFLDFIGVISGTSFLKTICVDIIGCILCGSIKGFHIPAGFSKSCLLITPSPFQTATRVKQMINPPKIQFVTEDLILNLFLTWKSVL